MQLITKILLSVLTAMVTVSLAWAELDVETQGLVDALNQDESIDYHRAKWAPIHFSPAIENASNEDCLACHQEVLDEKPLEQSSAGVKATEVLAWYQTLNTYEGEQDTFHRRHMVGAMAEKVMDLKCNTCHQGNDPREETVGSSADGPGSAVQRKMVDPNICLMCHGQFPYQNMAGLTGPWEESGQLFQNNCMSCHAVFRTNRHQVNFLKAEAIETEGTADGDVCYGCHGGRSWYRISYPYPRHAWPTMAPAVPDWAEGRPTESQERFLKDVSK